MQKLSVINGLRGWAIVAVIYHHLLSKVTPAGTGSLELLGLELLPLTILSNGWLGVNLFFMLSGFVLAYPYLLGRRHFDSLGETGAFYSHRAKRLLPLYYFSVLVCLVFVTGKSLASWEALREVALLGTLTFNFTSDMWFPRQNWVLWSLGIEFWFSIIFPVLILSIQRFGIAKVFLLVLVVSLATRLYGNPDIPLVVPLHPVRDSLLGRLDEFFWGIVVCHFYINKPELTGRLTPLLMLLLGSLFALSACWLWDYTRMGLLGTNLIPYYYLVLDIGLALIMLSFLLVRGGIIRWIASNYLLQLFGLMCYSLYVWHGVILLRIAPGTDALHIAIYLVILLLFCGLSYRYIEFGQEADTRKLFLLKQYRKSDPAHQ